MLRKSLLILIINLIILSSFAQGDDKKKNESVMFQSYAGGMWAPFGLMIGATYKKGHGFYVDARCNHHIFKTSHYYFVGNQVNNNSLHWTYDGSKVYSRWEVNAGAIIRIGKWRGLILRAYAGGGVERPRYLYSFKKAQSKTIDHTWVEYKELGGFMYNTEAGVTLNPGKEWYVQLGASSLTRKNELMMTFGVGKGL